MEKYDLIIIGSGPAGYVAAIRAAQLGMKVACVEKHNRLGGTCLNVGCIPSKNLLHVSDKFKNINKLSAYGINVKDYSLDLKKTMNAKDDVVKGLTNGIDALFVKNKVHKFYGKAKFVNKNQLQIKQSDENTINILGSNIIIATGSKPTELEAFKANGTSIVSSTNALSFTSVPKNFGVLGAGVIGLELGTVWNNFGSKVTVFEYADKLLPNMDIDVSKQMQKLLTEQGLNIKLNQKQLTCKYVDSKKVIVSSLVEGKEEFEFEKLLVSVGRKANTKDLGLKQIGVELYENGFIKVTEDFKTNVENIYAIGDVIGGVMLAHKASEEAVCLVEQIANIGSTVNYNIIPSVVYTNPELASVGFTEQELKDANINYVVGKFPFIANSRARAVLQSEGFVKLICHAETLQILGAHIIGSAAGELIQEVIVLMGSALSVKDLAHLPHSHPGYAEALKEAALDVIKQAIHI